MLNKIFKNMYGNNSNGRKLGTSFKKMFAGVK